MGAGAGGDGKEEGKEEEEEEWGHLGVPTLGARMHRCWHKSSRVGRIRAVEGGRGWARRREGRRQPEEEG